jgi:glycosyltransferase involved in cell wall biosynthesis
MSPPPVSQPLRVLLLTQYFWPESFPINELVPSLRESGCAITVLTGQPNYPGQMVFPGYRAAAVTTQTHAQGYTIYRVPVVPRGRATAIRLAANYASFIVSATLIGPWLLRRQVFDVVFVYAPSPILQAIPAVALKWLKRARLVIWVQDLWPQSLESTGFITNGYALKAVERVVRWIYRRTDLLLGQSRSFVASLREMSGSTVVDYFPNPGTVGSDSHSPSSIPVLRLEPGFNVLFAGNLGTVQALDTILDAAEIVRGDPEIRFVLVGSGSRSDWLKQEVERRGLTNVSLPGRFAAGAMPAILAQASALLVNLKRSRIMSQTIPTKIQAYLAAGRPIIAALDGEGAQVVLEAGAGVAAPAEDARALADAVLRLRALTTDERRLMGESGRRFYERHFDPRILAERLIAAFQELVDPPFRTGTH